MNITQADIRRFRQIWREEFEEEISEDQARYHIGRLDALFILLASPGRSHEAGLPESQVPETD